LTNRISSFLTHTTLTGIVAGFFLMTSPAYGETRATVQLSGTVLPRSSLDISGLPPADTMTVDGKSVAEAKFADAATDHSVLFLPLNFNAPGSPQIGKVGNMNISTNEPSGFTFTVSSGTFSSGDQQIPFRLTTVTQNSAAPTKADFMTGSDGESSTTTTSSGLLSRDLYITYATEARQTPASYTGSITLTISDN
jgi:hypothetical protein